MSDTSPAAVKDDNEAHPVAGKWRPVFREIVRALAEGDYSLSRGVPHVRRVPLQTAQQMCSYVSSYRATLIELSDESWKTSIAQWMRDHWEVLVDLWTAEEGKSDLVLDANVYEVANEFEVEIISVHVP